MLLLAAVAGAVLPQSAGAAARAFSNASALTIHGDIAAIGNANSTCRATWTTCNPAAFGSHNSNQGYGTLIDVDGIGTTTNSSASTVALPTGAVVRYARLVWGSAGDGTNNNGENSVSFDTPATAGITYSTVTAPYATQCGALPPASGNVRGFACAADVTALVTAGGSGAYTVGGVEQRASSGGILPDHWSGWGLYITYELATEPLRRIVLSDGFQVVTSGNPITIPITGFVAPASGTVSARLTYMVGEGDSGLTGDNATLGGTSLATPLPPDLMNSSISGLVYENAAARNPARTNHYGFDMDSVPINGAIANLATTTNFAFQSSTASGGTGETYYPLAVGVAIELGEPELVLTKTLNDVNGGVVEPGDVIEYQIVAQNTGNDGAAGVVMTDPIPARMTYVPGSMTVTAGANAGAKTDAAGDDQATFAANLVTMRLGTGANATQGGIIPSGGGSSTVRFRVAIDANVDEGVPLQNTASASYYGQTSLLAYADPSSVAATPARRADLTIAQVPSSGMTNGLPGSVALTASNIGGASTHGAPVTVTTTIPANVTYTGISASAGWTCTVTLPSISCTRTDTLAAASAYPSIVIAVTPNQTASGVTFAAQVAGGNEVNLANDTDSDTVGFVRSADLELTKSSSAATGKVGDTITYTVAVANHGPSNTTAVSVTDALPATLLPLTATSTQGSCTLATQTYTCGIGALTVGATATITITAQVRVSGAGQTIFNAASVAGADPDPLPANNTGQTSTVIDQQADLQVTKTVAPTSQNVGSNVAWTVTVRNNGPAAAAAATLTDDLPTGFTVQSIAPSQGSCGTGDPFTCTLGTLASGASATVVVVGHPQLASAGSVLVNTASATTTSADSQPANDSASAILTVNAAADLRIVKTVDSATANVDELLTWTLTATNDGPSAAVGTTITDTAPSGVTLQSVTPALGVACTTAGQVIACTVPSPLAAGATRTVTITATVDRASAASPVANSATVASAVFDPDNANNLSTVTTSVAAASDLRVTKTADRATANVGDTISWTVTATNDGPSAATAVQLTDTLPAGVTLLTRSVSQGSCAVVGSQLVCSLGGLAAGASATLTVTARVERAAAETPQQNVAQLVGSQFDPDTANNSTNVTTTIAAATDLQVTKTVDRATAAVGDTLQYTLVVTNGGPSAATGVQLTDTLPAGAQAAGTPTVSGGSCTVTGQLLSCTLPTLASGATRTITVPALVLPAAAGTTLSNVAQVTGTQFDPDPANNTSAVADTTIAGVAALALTKTVDRAAASVGDTLTYALVVTNSGPQAATGTTITETLPAGLTRLTAAASQGGCGAGNSFTCSLGTVPAGGSATVTITAQVDLAAAGTTVVNSATAASTQADPSLANNTATATTTIAPAADLRITKTADRATADVGDTITWTVTAFNDGPQGATGVVVTDTVPAGVTLNPVSAPSGVSCTTVGQTVSCALAGTLASGAQQAITLSGVVKRAAAASPLLNSATIGGSQLDPNVANNLSSVTTNVNAAADVRVSKSVDRATANVGDTLTWTVSATNDGPSVAPAVVLVDDLPAGTTLLTSAPTQGSCAVSGAQLVCSLGALGVGSTATVTLTARVERPAAESPVNNVARVTAGVFDPDTANNLATAATTIGPSTDLQATKTVDRATANVGDVVTYTLTATNLGPSAATGVSLTDTLPATLQRLSQTPSQGSCTTAGALVSCALGTLADGASATVQIQARVLAAAGASTISNTTQVTGAQSDPTLSNNVSAPATTAVAAATDLSLTKSVDHASANVGDTLTYTLAVRNAGPQNATAVHAVDTLPAGLTVLSASATQGSCVTTAGSVDCTVGTVAAGASPVTVTITARVLSGAAASTLVNSAVVSGAQLDPSTADNTATAATTIAAAADLRVGKSVDRATANVGELVTFTLTATNDGPQPATGVTLTDTLPSGLQVVGTPSVTPGSCSVVGQVVTCIAGPLANGASAGATIVARVTFAAAASTVANVARVSGNEFDPTPGNDTSPATSTVVAAAADLAVTQSVDSPALNLGDVATFTITVHNNGPSPATGATLSDDLPAGTSLISRSTSQGSCGSGDPLACTLGTIPSGATVTVVVVLRVDVGASAVFTSQATATATEHDPSSANNSASASISTGPSADLRVVKAADRATAQIGETITWTITATNDGPSPATGVVVTDAIPAGISNVSASGGSGVSCTVGATAVSCAIAGPWPTAAPRTITLSGEVDRAQAGSPVANQASIAGAEFDPDLANNLSSVTTTVPDAADLRVVKTADRATATVGDTITWTVAATNDGPSAASGVVLTDDLPAGATLLSTGATQGSCATVATQLICAVGTLASGQTATVTLTARVEVSAAESPLVNAARVTATAFDPDTANNVSTVTTAVGPSVDLSTSAAVNRTTANIGDALFYTFTIFNSGPSAATGVSFRQLLPADVTYVSSNATQGGCALSAGQLTCALGTLASGADATVTVRVSADPAAAGTTISARGTSSAAEPDRDPANDTSAIVQTSIADAADLRVGTTVDRPSAAVSDTIVYTVAVTNDGPSTATGVQLTNQLPAGTTVLAVMPSQGTCDTADPRNCALGTLAPGATATLIVQVRAETAGAVATDAATAGADQFDPVLANNADAAGSGIGDAADLRIVKSVDHATAETGDTLSWTLTATNLGPQTATGVTVTDALPAGVTLTAVTTTAGSCTGGLPVSCTLGTLTSGQGAVITITGVVQRAAAGQPLTGQATITGAQFDPVPANNVSAATTPVGPAADLRVTKLVSDAAPQIGDPVSWTIQVFNDGPLSAPNVAVTDVVPAGATITAVGASTGSCTRTGQSIVCDLGTLTSGSSATVTVSATVARAAGGAVLDNGASVASGIRDPDTTNNTATARATAGPAADLSVTLSPDRPSATVGEAISWTAVVANGGPQTATGIVTTITLPPGLTGATASVPGGSCTITAGTVTCLVPDLPSGTSVPVAITGVAGRASAETSLRADAVVAGTRPDELPTNNTAAATLVRVPAAVDLVVTKRVDRATARVGELVTFTTTVENRGPSATTGVTLTETLPAGVTLATAVPSQGTCSVAGQLLTCALGPLADGQTVTLELTVTITAAGAGQSLPSAAAATSPEFDLDATNNAAEARTAANPSTPGATLSGASHPKLLITKTVDDAAPSVGDSVVFTITATNSGSGIASGVRLTDALPAGLEYVGTTATGATCARNARTITCTVAALAAGRTATVRVTAKVLEAGRTIKNTATGVAAGLADAKAAGQTASARLRATGQAPFIVAGVKPLEAYTRPGRHVRIAVKITNVGQSTARDTVACIVLPRGVVLLRKPAGMTQRGAKFCLSAARVAPGKHKRVVLSGRVVGPAGTSRPTIAGTSANSRMKTEAYPLVVRGALTIRRASGVTG